MYIIQSLIVVCTSYLMIDESEKASKLEMDVSRDGMALGRSATESPASRTILTPPPSAASASSDNEVLNCGIADLPHLTFRYYLFILTYIKLYMTRIYIYIVCSIGPDDPDYCRFKKQYCLYWGAMVEALDQLQQMLLDFAVPLARVCGERLAACVQRGELDWRDGRGRCTHVEKLSVLENRDEVWDLMCQPGQRYKGIEGHQAAAVCIQTCWRRYSARTAYLLQLRPKWAARIIAMSLLKHAKLGHLKKSLQASRLHQLENYRIRAESLAGNWKHITSTKRTIIHDIPNISLRGFDVLQNPQMGRLCDIRDENIKVIYVSPVHLGEDVLQYYTRLLGLQTAIELGHASAPESHCAKRFTIFMPSTGEFFSMTRNMCLASLLKYSPRTLQRIKNLIQGKHIDAHITHIDDLAVLYSTKSGGRRIFNSAGVNMPPGKWDIYTLEQVSLARLMTEHMEVQRWLFKIDSEVGGRGMAYCDVCHLKRHPWAQQEFSRHRPEQWRTSQSQESVMIKFLEEFQLILQSTSNQLLVRSFLILFLFYPSPSTGGVIEAFPPSDSLLCLTVDLLVEHIMGHISLDLVIFLHPSNLEQQVWAIDLDLGYSNQLAMTQLMLMMTRGTLDVKSSVRNARIKTKAVRIPRLFLRVVNRTISEDLQGALLTFARNLSIIHQEISAPNMQGTNYFKVCEDTSYLSTFFEKSSIVCHNILYNTQGIHLLTSGLYLWLHYLQLKSFKCRTL
uniref:IQ motif containing H n=1 Tax=Sinocyclocheilus grahami TaxID=75366 RepID=A0A672N890_SINGR